MQTKKFKKGELVSYRITRADIDNDPSLKKQGIKVGHVLHMIYDPIAHENIAVEEHISIKKNKG